MPVRAMNIMNSKHRPLNILSRAVYLKTLAARPLNVNQTAMSDCGWEEQGVAQGEGFRAYRAPLRAFPMALCPSSKLKK